MPDLLIELLSEEIPARMQRRASLDFEKLLTDGISELGLSYESSAAFTTPRRLVLVLENVSIKVLAALKRKGDLEQMLQKKQFKVFKKYRF
ncbi:MAG: hypothetical protein CM15mP85_16200 [Rhodobacterales bacterium]|nr:MAG: hypothetical protein CM15mP85_16200 [Rhodobacterales bacterium]